MAITAKVVDSKKQWEECIASYDEANFLQAWQWGEARRQLGQTVYRIGFFRDSRLIGGFLGCVEAAKRGRYLSIAGGPLVDWQDQEVRRSLVEELRRLARQEGCVFVRLRPQIEDNNANRRLFAGLGLRPAQMHLEAELTSQLDLGKSEQELLKNMRKNTRYEIKKANKRGIIVTMSKNPQDVKAFYELQLETAKRHKFIAYGYRRLYEQFKAFVEDDKVALYSASTREGQLIAQAMIMFYNQEASYHYGASTELARSEPGAYAVQWQAIKDAKQRGCQRYNFWGVVEEEDTGHRFYGVSVFKRGFRGSDVRYLHAHDLIIKRWRYLINYIVEYFRKRYRRL